MENKTLSIILVTVTTAAIILAVAGASLYTRGYYAAWEDYKNGEIECVVKVKYPNWMNK